MNAYLGVDIGSISTKGVVIDEDNNILASDYIWTKGNPIDAVKRLIDNLKVQVDNNKVKIVGIGTTGSARKLIGTMLDATVIKNEITAHAIGTLSLYPDVRTIFEIGGQDSKIILIEDGIVTDFRVKSRRKLPHGAQFLPKVTSFIKPKWDTKKKTSSLDFATVSSQIT